VNDSTEAFETLRKSLAPATIEHLALTRDCTALSLPGGDPVSLERDWEVTLIREVGDAFVVQVPLLGGEYRIDGADADALGKRPHRHGEPHVDDATRASPQRSLRERVREHLELVNDPELPVSIIDLGLVYAIDVNELSPGSFQAEIEMTLTTQACGMGAMISRDVQRVVAEIAEVSQVDVRIVWEPAWTPHRITERGRRKLGME
jgi:metal-sulfur cluster biosynthetic enzyme